MILEDCSGYSVDSGLEHNLKCECNSSVKLRKKEEREMWVIITDNHFLCYLFQRTIIFKMAQN